jgi:molecular chaperone DnaK
MMDQAQRYAEEDKKRRETADTLNAADSVCYQAERTLAEFGAKLPADLRGRVEPALREAREPVAKRDAPAAEQKANALKTVLQEPGQALYAQAPQPGAKARAAGPASGARVVDAEYRDTAGAKP